MITFGFFEQKNNLTFVIIALLVASIACQLDLGGPDIPVVDQPTSEEAAKSLEDQWQTLAEQAENEGGQVTLILSEEQLTSFLRSRLASQEQTVLYQPAIQLEDGLIRLFGTVEQDYAKAQVLVEVQVVVSESGQPSFEIVSAEFGPLPLPEPIKDSIESLIAEAFSGSVGPYLTGIRLESIAITDGEMAIIGDLR